MSTILLISGSLRNGSANSAMLRTALELAPEGYTAVLYDAMAGLPHFNPDDDSDPLPAPVIELRAAINQSAAILFSTPEYAGALPGSFKNLLDWTVGDADCVGKPVAWVNASTSPGGARNAHHSLRLVAEYTGFDIVDEACCDIPLARSAIGHDGLVADPDIRWQLADVLAALVRRHERVSETGR